MTSVIGRPVAYLAVLATSIFMMAPFLWMLSSSFKPLNEIFGVPPTLVAAHPTISNYVDVFEQAHAWLKLWNSFYLALFGTALSVLLCSLGGYAFAKFRFPARELLFNMMLVIMVIPFAVLLVPLFVMMRNLFHWIDAPWPLIIPGAANAFGIFFMRQYLLPTSDEMLDAARVDGASELRIFWTIVLPTSVPGLATLGIIFFMSRWNDFLWPLTVVHTEAMQTMPLMLNSLYTPNGLTGYHLLMAGSVISVLPLLLVFLVLQRYFHGRSFRGGYKRLNRGSAIRVGRPSRTPSSAAR